SGRVVGKDYGGLVSFSGAAARLRRPQNPRGRWGAPMIGPVAGRDLRVGVQVAGPQGMAAAGLPPLVDGQPAVPRHVRWPVQLLEGQSPPPPSAEFIGDGPRLHR